MRRHIPIVISAICGASAWLGADASAQSLAPELVVARASTSAGRVSGLVRDAAGLGLADASVLALGETVVSVRSDIQGHFLLSLPPGDYILKATRAGYVSNYREPVRVLSSTQLERTITLTRQGGPLSEQTPDDSHAHTDIAWALRHLTRSVLRDGAMIEPSGSDPGRAGRANAPSLGRAADASPRLAMALAGADFRGQLNFVTTASVGPIAGLLQSAWPRGVAYVALGAPVVGYGAWKMHAAVASGDGSSWNILGAYESDSGRAHLWKMRFSYSAQGYTQSTERLSAAVALARSAAGVSAQDRWRVTPALDIEYGARAERFDYLADTQLFSANGGFSFRVLPRTFLKASAAQDMIAPGADEFLPPPAGGPWLPAERMFFPLSGRGALRAEEVRHAEVALAYHVGSGDAWPTVHVRRFRQRSRDQMATLFGVVGHDDRGEYFVAQIGTVDLIGWGAGLSGQIGPYLHGQVEYAQVSSAWQTGSRVRDVRRAAPSVLRDDVERLQDVTASLEASLARNATHLSLVYRANSAFSRADGAPKPGLAGRFDLQVRQALPYQPTRGSRLELLFSIRNLFRDVRGEASWYDELLTVGPPLRFMGGIQVRF